MYSVEEKAVPSLAAISIGNGTWGSGTWKGDPDVSRDPLGIHS